MILYWFLVLTQYNTEVLYVFFHRTHSVVFPPTLNLTSTKCSACMQLGQMRTFDQTHCAFGQLQNLPNAPYKILRFFGEISSNGCKPRQECHDNQQRLEDAEFSRAPWKNRVDCKRRTASGREFQSVMVRGKNECLKTSVRTSNDINFFSLETLVCRD